MPDGPSTLGRWTADRARTAPDAVAIDDRGVVVTYRELDERAARLAESFRAAGYAIGDRVATITGNSADQVVLFFACAKAGLVLVPLSWRLSPRELAEQLEIAEPALLLVEDEFASVARAARDRLARRIPVAPLGAHGVEQHVPHPALRTDATVTRRDVRDDDALLIVFTSGTTSRPKGAVLTHANCFWTNLSLSKTIPIAEHDVVLAVMPQFHVGGWNIQPLLGWWAGATVVLERTFDPGRVLHLIAERRITTMMGVPANYLFLAQHPDFSRADLSSLGQAVVGGAPMPPALLRLWHARGVALTQGYGLTEASPNVLCLPDREATSRVGSAGLPYAHVDVAVADPATGELLDGPAEGELLVSGPGVFAGYFRDPEATAAALSGGWLHTGDLVRRDADGYFTVVDRLTDVYISGGEGVSPAEVESVLIAHPAVADVAVVGVPDDRWGEAGSAWVVLRPGAITDGAELTEFARGSLAGYKVPRDIHFIDEIPRGAATKTLRRVLAERAARLDEAARPEGIDA
ncbi:fatty-acyl-CoA synthase [Agromyces flavus]|uniref:Fatty-acyl-CoA synthase n=1 Tax=Agromyces flavus TaxID=589382 RepID=A0A1H1TSG9_9MICO|nr:AMP-binding protein [Agromyces flavus]MCP2368371.1 fatty-acyl-CoA synthase [Agromyces flavus]GGI47832.1 acid--CoA ligase [Agromyces flavus]SDS62876.1 fatty-acyl-CoA synthase [Agromyces flavus]